jgi:hypothetical protein
VPDEGGKTRPGNRPYAANPDVGTQRLEAESVRNLLNDWLTAWAQWAAANADGQSVRSRNRIIDQIWALSDEVAAHPELHAEVVALCGPEQDEDTRLRAALIRERWDLAGADETLVAVIEGSGASITRPLTMTSALAVRTTKAASDAALCLLNIDSGRGNTGKAASAPPRRS